MVYYDHGMLGATVAVAFGAQRRHGWAIVVMAALASMFPDWDALSKHISPETYRVGHRYWGHNLFVVTLAGIALGGLGYLIHKSIPRPAKAATGDSATPWIVLGVAIMWTHPLLDVLYCGVESKPDWPVGLLWPLKPEGYAYPWMPWSDWGATAILAAGLVAIAMSRERREQSAGIALAVVTGYVFARGIMLR